MRTTLALLSVVVAVSGQSVGDIAAVAHVRTDIAVTEATGGESLYASAAMNQYLDEIIWDPSVPDSFIVGGWGFVGRVTLLSPGVSFYTPLGTAAGRAGDLDFDEDGNVVIGDTFTDHLYRLDLSTGVTTPITSGPQPWGEISAMAVDRATGDIYVGDNSGVYRVSGGVSSVLLYSPINNDFAFDPFTGDLMVASSLQGRLKRLNRVGNLTEEYAPQSLIGSFSIAVDENGDFVMGVGWGHKYRVTNGTGAITYLGLHGQFADQNNALAVVGGLDRAGPFSTHFTLDPNQLLRIWPHAVPPGTVEGWTLLTRSTPTPVGGGSVFGITPDAITLGLWYAFPVAQAGSLFHWVRGVPIPAYPSAPFMVPPFIYMNFTGETWDTISLAFDGAGGLLSTSAVDRITFP